MVGIRPNLVFAAEQAGHELVEFGGCERDVRSPERGGDFDPGGFQISMQEDDDVRELHQPGLAQRRHLGVARRVEGRDAVAAPCGKTTMEPRRVLPQKLGVEYIASDDQHCVDRYPCPPDPRHASVSHRLDPSRDVDFLRKQLRVNQQVKIVRGRLIIDKPKGGRTRVVPLPDWVADGLARHLRQFPAEHDELVFTSREHKPLNRNHVNGYVWRPALVAAGVKPGRGNGMHARRHFYASVLIDAGESASAVAEYLGHADPGFTLRVYAHLFPSSEDRARRAIDGVFRPSSDGPQAAQEGR